MFFVFFLVMCQRVGCMYFKCRVFVAELRKQNKLIEEKKDNLLKMIGEVKNKKQELEGLTANIQDLKEEYCRKKESKFVVTFKLVS